MGWYEEQLLPRVVNRACASKGLVSWRRRAAAGLTGRVVEVGFGSGLNLDYLPRAVEEVLAVDPATVAYRLAADRIARSSPPIKSVGLDGQAIALDDESCDSVLATFTLCTVPDADLVLREIRRILRPGGSFHFLEHGLAPESGVARWQRRLDPIQQRLAGGCHLSRDPLALIQASGLDVEWCDQGYAKGPKPWTYLSVGVATKLRG